jgi:hypothetical protein
MPLPFRNTDTGQIETYPDLDEAQSAALLASRPELRPALPEEVQTAAKYREHSTAFEKLKGAAELGVGVASLGQIASDSPEAKARRAALRQENPVITGVVEQGAAIVPAIAAGALTGGLGAAAGMSAAAAARAAFIAESLTVGSAVEAEHAREEGRDIDLSSIVQGLALDVATAGVGRAARGVFRRGSRAERASEGTTKAVGAGVDAAESLEDAASAPKTAIARANRISKERRSVGAAGKDAPKPKPPERAEVQDYAQNRDAIDADVDELGYSAINDAIGGDAPAFREVHKISLKRGDVLGRMTDADDNAVLDFAVTQTERAERLAQKLEADGAKQAAATIRDHIQRIDAAIDGEHFLEDTAIGLDQMKRTLDDYRSRFGSYGAKGNDPLRERVSWVDEVLDPADMPLRKGLEDRNVWGKLWADKQLEENRLWSGSDSSQLSGLINTSKVWQRAFAEPHAGIKVRSGLEDVPVFKSKGDIVKIAKSMNDRDFDETMNAFDTWIDKAKQMNAIKAELGVDSISRTPIARLETALDRMAALSQELKQVRKLEKMSEPLRKHYEKMGESKALAQTLYEGARELPGVGTAIKTAEKVPGAREGIARFLEPDPAPMPVRPSPDEALGRIGERQRKRREGWMSERAQTPRERAEEYMRRRKQSPERAPEPKPGPSATPGERGFAELGAMAGAGAAGLGALGMATMLDDGSTPMTDALAELSDHSRAILDRASLGLFLPDTRAPRLPGVLDRFKGDSPDLRTAFANVLDMLQTAHNDPAAFIEAMTEAYGDVGAQGHDDLAQRVIARTAVAVQYLLANLPPNLAASVTRPEGAPIDALAVAEFAKLWSGAMRPGDVIYDVGTGRATPTQIRALREVHPDIYTNLRIAVIRALGEARTVPFETKRQLDMLFDIDGAAGPSFSSSFTKTMATARANNTQSSQSLGGESVVAPQTATKIFSNGPSAIR